MNDTVSELDEAGLKKAAWCVDPSGIFGLSWQECEERASAIVRAYLAATKPPLAEEVTTCDDFVADPCGSSRCHNCGKRRNEHTPRASRTKEDTQQ
jgi:hypothetical protein